MRNRPAGSSPRALSPARHAAVAAFAALALSACAGGPGGPPAGHRGANGPGAPALFISPFGEPFIAGPEDPWPVADWFRGADANQDEAMTFDEFTADGLRWFGALDADRDGRLNQAELAAYETSLHGFGPGPGGPAASSGRPGGAGEQGGGGRRRPGGGMAENLALGEPQSRGGGHGGGGQRGGGGGGGDARGPRGYGIVAEAGFFNLPQPVKAADINVDQRVTTQEWAAATQRWFLALDTDHDGRLTLATLPKTPLQQRAEARRR